MTTRKLSARSRAKIKKALEVMAAPGSDQPLYHITIHPAPLEIDVSGAEFAQAVAGNAETDLDEITSLLVWEIDYFPEDSGYTYEVIEVASGRVVEQGDNFSLNKKL
jgi:hypothetical protein